MKSNRECWLRARRPDQKAERRQAILDAAAAMFDAKGYDAVSLNGIAREVGVAKSNLYRYFQSKEEIFLVLLEEAHETWVDDAEAALLALPRPATPDQVGAAIAASLSRSPRLCALAAIVSSVLERNVTEERIVEHKQGSVALLMRMMNALTQVRPSLTMDKATLFLRLAYALVTGLWPVANPPANVRAVLARPAFAFMQAEFEVDLAAGLANLLIGLSGAE